MNGILLGGRGRVRAYPAAQTTTTGGGGGGGGGGYTPPSWPPVEADEEFRAALDVFSNLAFRDVSGKGNDGAISGQRPSFSHFYGRAATCASGGSCRVMGYAALRRNREWTVDMVCVQHKNLTATAAYFYLSNIAGGNLKGGLQIISPNQWQVWTPAGWVSLTNVPMFYTYGPHSTDRLAITMQWGSDNILRLWINGIPVYTSGVLAPPAIVGDEGIYIPNGPSIEFFRYRAAAPPNPESWQSAALYGS